MNKYDRNYAVEKVDEFCNALANYTNAFKKLDEARADVAKLEKVIEFQKGEVKRTATLLKNCEVLKCADRWSGHE